jgi:hypothetical protein
MTLITLLATLQDGASPPDVDAPDTDEESEFVLASPVANPSARTIAPSEGEGDDVRVGVGVGDARFSSACRLHIASLLQSPLGNRTEWNPNVTGATCVVGSVAGPTVISHVSMSPIAKGLDESRVSTTGMVRIHWAIYSTAIVPLRVTLSRASSLATSDVTIPPATVQ